MEAKPLTTTHSKNSSQLRIIIDGADRMGKTTTAKLLAKTLNVPLIPGVQLSSRDRSQLTGVEIENNTKQHHLKMIRRTKSFVADRGYPTSIVYSYYFKRKVSLRYLEKFDKKFQVFILDRINPIEVDDMLLEEENAAIADVYRFNCLVRNWDLVFCEDRTPEQVVAMIIRRLKCNTYSVVESQAFFGTTTYLNTKS